MARPGVVIQRDRTTPKYRVRFSDGLDRITPPSTSWWQDVPRTDWQAAITAQQPRLSKSQDGVRLATNMTV
jgi:hypothetical protein